MKSSVHASGKGLVTSRHQLSLPETAAGMAVKPPAMAIPLDIPSRFSSCSSTPTSHSLVSRLLLSEGGKTVLLNVSYGPRCLDDKSWGVAPLAVHSCYLYPRS